MMPGAILGGKISTRHIKFLVKDLFIFIAATMGVKICQIGASYSGLNSCQLSAWRRRRKWYFRISPRDSLSKAYLPPDFAFNIFAAGSNRLSCEHPVQTSCLSFRTDQFKEQFEEVATVASLVCKNAHHITKWSLMVQVARDLLGMQSVQSMLLQAGVRIEPVVDLHRDVDACLAHYREISLAVSNRLHVLLMAASQGAKILALTHHSCGAKLEGVLRDLGLQSAIVNIREFNRLGPSSKPGLWVDGTEKRRQLRRAFDELVA